MSTVGGGIFNTNLGNYSTLAGGYQDRITNGNAAIGGGRDNLVGGSFSTVPGGLANTAIGNYSLAAGRRAQANHAGSFVWADSQNADFGSTTNDSVQFRCAGGVRFDSGTVAANQALSWAPGSASWSFTSDRATKDRVTSVNPEMILARLTRIPISEWSYIGYDQRHIGPMAQDFHTEFPLNDNNKILNEADLHGVALAAIQGLNQKVEKENTAIRAENAELKARLEKLEQLINGVTHRGAK